MFDQIQVSRLKINVVFELIDHPPNLCDDAISGPTMVGTKIKHPLSRLREADISYASSQCWSLIPTK